MDAINVPDWAKKATENVIEVLEGFGALPSAAERTGAMDKCIEDARNAIYELLRETLEEAVGYV